jgi:hypothetical protein
MLSELMPDFRFNREIVPINPNMKIEKEDIFIVYIGGAAVNPKTFGLFPEYKPIPCLRGQRYPIN